MKKLQDLVNDLTTEFYKEDLFERFDSYAEKIQQKDYSQFRINLPKNLNKYINIKQAISKNPQISLLYLGQQVAYMDVRKDKNDCDYNIAINDTVKKYFEDFPEFPNNKFYWKSTDGTNFRQFFDNTETNKLHSEEHKHESLIISEFEKTKSENKSLLNIQPIKIAGQFRFQMASPVNGKGEKGMGNIDILARVGRGISTNIAIVELKVSKDYFKNNNGIEQVLNYAVSIRELLRKSKANERWIEIFGFGKNRLNRGITFYAVLMVPENLKDQAKSLLDSFDTKLVKIENDTIQLASIFYKKEDDNQIVITETDGFNGEVKINAV